MMPIFYSEINILCIMFLLLIYFKIKQGTALQRRQHLFRAVLLSNCFFFTLDALWICIDNKSLVVGTSANWALNVMYYITSGVVSYCWFLYSENVQRSRLVQSRKGMILCAVPIMLLTALTLASVRYGWLFYIDADNAYHRGPLYALQLLLSYGYVVFTAVKALLLSRRTESYFQKIECRTLACFVVAPLAMGFIQVLFPGLALLCVGTTFSCLYVFITMQEQMISTDALTGLNNRNKLMHHLSDSIAHADKKLRLFLVMMDLDHFKSINDSYGHVEGDNALRIVADVLKTCCDNRHYFIARYGGDEFSTVCTLAKNERIEDFYKRIVKTLKSKSEKLPYELSISIGWKEYGPDVKSAQELIRFADASLYEAKQQKSGSRI